MWRVVVEKWPTFNGHVSCVGLSSCTPCHLPPTPCHLPPTTCQLPPTSLPPTTYHLPPATCHLPPTNYQPANYAPQALHPPTAPPPRRTGGLTWAIHRRTLARETPSKSATLHHVSAMFDYVWTCVTIETPSKSATLEDHISPPARLEGLPEGSELLMGPHRAVPRLRRL